MSHRQKEILRLRRELNDLKKAWKEASTEIERTGIDLLEDEVKDNLKKLTRQECNRKRRWRRRKARSKFFRDPFGTTREVLSPRVDTNLAVSKEDLDTFMHAACSDAMRDVPLGDLEGLPAFDISSIHAFDTSGFKWNEYNSLMKSRQNASRAGLNQISYKVYKKCPKLARYLFSTDNAVRKSRKVPLNWSFRCDLYP